MKQAVALAVSSAVVLGLTGAALSSPSDVWKPLRRPLHIPKIAPGGTCPASLPDRSVDFGSLGVGQGYGPGPAYPIFGGAPELAELTFDYPPPHDSAFAGSKWGGQKVLWFLLPRHGARALVRGRQLDGPYRVRFDRGGVPSKELKLVAPGDRASSTRLRTGGCYGYQIDGPGYSRVIVFRATLHCLSVPVDGDRVHAGPFTGLIDSDYDILDGRFRLHVGQYRDRATGLSQKIPWFLPKRYRVGSSLSVRGTRLAPPGRTFTEQLQEASSSDSPGQHVFPSAFAPPTAGCWKLSFKTRRVTGSLVVLVRNG